MLPKFIVLVICVASLASNAAADLVEFKPRSGLPNFFAKAKGTGEVRVAYLGGSITAADGWRSKSRKWFGEQFPAAKFTEIHAAIGGTGSDLGVFRLQRDVLDHRPDLLFVEFAVNDAGAQREQIHRTMEGIVRQTWRAFPDCDICFVYTIAGNMLQTLQAGKLPRSAESMEELADFYAIPSINFGLEVARMEKEGKLIFKAPKPANDAQKAALGGKMIFSSDGVHPHSDTGHEVYLKSIARSFEQMRGAPGTPVKHELKTPMRADNWEQAKMLPIEQSWLTGKWVKLPATNSLAKSFGNRVPALWRGEPGDAMTFRFRGTAAYIYDLLGPDCGQLRLTLDGKDMGLRSRFDSYCTYHRLGMTGIGSALTNAVHEVKLTVESTPLDKAKILSQRNEKIDKPARFEGLNWYPGALLIVGNVE